MLYFYLIKASTVIYICFVSVLVKFVVLRSVSGQLEYVFGSGWCAQTEPFASFVLSGCVQSVTQSKKHNYRYTRRRFSGG
jgi:hypothetical protein